VIDGQDIVRLYDWLPVHPLVSVAVIVNVYVPDTVGVPDSTPVDEFKKTPVGKVPDVVE
jgi:hypothetical protein